MLVSKTLYKVSTVFMCFFLFSSATGQKFGFRHYGAEYGIPDGFVYTINQSEDGFLWVGTGNGLLKFDGYNYYRVAYPDSIESRNTYVSFRDRNGTIWFGCNDGTVFFTRGNSLRKLDINNSRSICQILEGPDSMLYIVPQGKAIFRLDISKPDEVDQFLVPDGYTFFSATFDGESTLMAGSQGNILLLETGGDSISVRGVIEGFEYSAVTSVCLTGRDFLIGTEDNGVFILRSQHGYAPERISEYPEFSTLNVRSIYRDAGGKIWISTFGTGVIQLGLDRDGKINSLRRYNTAAGLPSDDARLVFQDAENNYWFGMFGEGLSMLVSYAFGFYTPGEDTRSNNIIFVRDFGQYYMLGTPAGYHVFDAGTGMSRSFVDLSAKLGGSDVLSYFLDGQNRLWIGTNGKGLFIRESNGSVRPFFRSGDTGSDEIRDIQMDETNVWLATTNGVIVLDKQRGIEKKRFGTSESLPHNFINKILLHDGEVYIGTECDRLYKIDRDFNPVTDGCMMTGSAKNRIMALAGDKDGGILAATSGNGVFACYPDSVVSKTRTTGLFSNYCYSIMSDSRNNIWVGHEKGFSLIDNSTGIVTSYGAEYAYGGIANAGGIFESKEGKIFIGTTSGVVIYDRNEDNIRHVPPYNNITSIIINDREYAYAPVINLPYSKYRVTISYSGINFSSPEKVYYSTFLENFDTDWSAMTTDRKVSYNLSDGRYRFHLLSVDEHGLSGEQQIILSIQVAKPLIKQWWFILLIAMLVVATIVIIVRRREKAQKKLRLYLEEELEKRTSVIMKQKGEIELQNIEITDSINYAKRIQSSILPDIGKLRENFKDAFIIFHPRDIVSGDFYWFDKTDEDKFIVVCADSTGHGVPGALMSMIGSTILQDIITRKKITRPSQVLSLLDQQLFSTLNQNVDLGVANDGMDMVVCEFNVKTRHMRFASAMRPIILVISGEFYYIKGNRSSIGGESVIEKYFDDQEYYLNEGDTIYLFSDGFPDQFGGEDGKKMKIARMKRLMDQIITMPMHEQEKAIMEFFEEWKNGYDQVDDILMIGIRV